MPKEADTTEAPKEGGPIERKLRESKLGTAIEVGEEIVEKARAHPRAAATIGGALASAAFVGNPLIGGALGLATRRWWEAGAELRTEAEAIPKELRQENINVGLFERFRATAEKAALGRARFHSERVRGVSREAGQVFEVASIIEHVRSLPPDERLEYLSKISNRMTADVPWQAEAGTLEIFRSEKKDFEANARDKEARAEALNPALAKQEEKVLELIRRKEERGEEPYEREAKVVKVQQQILEDLTAAVGANLRDPEKIAELTRRAKEEIWGRDPGLQGAHLIEYMQGWWREKRYLREVTQRKQAEEIEKALNAASEDLSGDGVKEAIRILKEKENKVRTLSGGVASRKDRLLAERDPALILEYRENVARPLAEVAQERYRKAEAVILDYHRNYGEYMESLRKGKVEPEEEEIVAQMPPEYRHTHGEYQQCSQALEQLAPPPEETADSTLAENLLREEQTRLEEVINQPSYLAKREDAESELRRKKLAVDEAKILARMPQEYKAAVDRHDLVGKALKGVEREEYSLALSLLTTRQQELQNTLGKYYEQYELAKGKLAVERILGTKEITEKMPQEYQDAARLRDTYAEIINTLRGEITPQNIPEVIGTAEALCETEIETVLHEGEAVRDWFGPFKKWNAGLIKLVGDAQKNFSKLEGENLAQALAWAGGEGKGQLLGNLGTVQERLGGKLESLVPDEIVEFEKMRGEKQEHLDEAEGFRLQAESFTPAITELEQKMAQRYGAEFLEKVERYLKMVDFAREDIHGFEMLSKRLLETLPAKEREEAEKLLMAFAKRREKDILDMEKRSDAEVRDFLDEAVSKWELPLAVTDEAISVARSVRRTGSVYSFLFLLMRALEDFAHSLERR